MLKTIVNSNYTTTCQHDTHYGFPKEYRPYDIYACNKPIGHVDEHGNDWRVWPNDGVANTDVHDFRHVGAYLVGGAVRDYVMKKVNPKDFDFAIEAKSYDQMKHWLLAQGFEPFLESPEHLTIRARATKKFSFYEFDLTGYTYDFVLCRKDGPYSDGRHPDYVEVGTIYDDLARRDFTMNAIAITEHGLWLDPHDGIWDIKRKLIRCVGGTERLEEDGLRVLRALRFKVQLGFDLAKSVDEFLWEDGDDVISRVKPDRVRDELTKMFTMNTMATLEVLVDDYPHIARTLFGEGSEGNLWLEPTSKKRSVRPQLPPNVILDR